MAGASARRPVMSLQSGRMILNVMDDCCDTHNSLAAGAGDRLYHGFVYSHSICNGCCPGVGQHQSGGYDLS